MKPYEWLNEDSRTFLSRGYVREGQTAEERIQEIADYAASMERRQPTKCLWKDPAENGTGFRRPDPLFDPEKFVSYMAQGFYSLSSPVWANFGANRSLPISCNGSYVGDSMESILSSLAEIGMMTKHGAGTSAYFDLRERGADINSGGKSSGPVSFMPLYDCVANTVSQSNVRRGSLVTSMDIEHPDIMEFLELREEGSEVKNLSLGVCVSDEFMGRLEARDKKAMTVWARVLKKRFESGYPYVFFSDTVNRLKPECYKDSYIWASNLCQEICLPSSILESFVCCLASMNAAEFDNWKSTDAVQQLIYFLDLVITDYVNRTENMPFMEKANRFARRHRALGLGVLGWHTYLQRKSIAFESFAAMSHNNRLFQTIHELALSASEALAAQYGECEMTRGTGRRNTTLTAVAPTKSSSFILGQVSGGIEPHDSNYELQDLAKGKFGIRNPELIKVLESYGKNTEETWKSILMKGGSVQHLDFLTDHEKEVYKTFQEISQLTIIQQAGQRQRWIDQSQSLNLKISKDVPVKEVNALMITAWKMGVKTLYYQKGTNPAQELGRAMSCRACEA